MKKRFLLLATACITISQLSGLEQELDMLATTLNTLFQKIGGPKTVITEEQKEQLVNVLKDLDTSVESEFVTTQDWISSLKIAIDTILKGFDRGGNYIGYPQYQGQFLQRHVNDFEAALKLLQAAAPNDPKIRIYLEWRPALQQAVGSLPLQQDNPSTNQ